METTTIVTEEGRMVSLKRPQYMINAVRTSGGALRIPSRVVEGSRVNTYIREMSLLSLATATASAAAPKVEAVKEEAVEETKAEAVKG